MINSVRSETFLVELFAAFVKIGWEEVFKDDVSVGFDEVESKFQSI